MKYKSIVLLLLIFATSLCYAQSKDTIVNMNSRIYYSLESAIKEPDKVEILFLKRKHLDDFPKEIFQLKNLRVLDLSRNKIKELPKEISILTKLEKLDMSQNRLTKLPTELGNLKNLKILNLNRNEIDSLPPTIGQLINLVKIDLWGNEIGSMPKEIGYIKNNLKILDLRVIQMKEALQTEIELLLPTTKIYFSEYCNCN